MSTATAPSIDEAIGDDEALVAAVDDFYARVLADPQLAPYFEGTRLNASDFDKVACHLTRALTAARVPPGLISQIMGTVASLVRTTAEEEEPGSFPG